MTRYIAVALTALIVTAESTADGPHACWPWAPVSLFKLTGDRMCEQFCLPKDAVPAVNQSGDVNDGKCADKGYTHFDHSQQLPGAYGVENFTADIYEKVGVEMAGAPSPLVKCVSCDLVPCGECQEGCKRSTSGCPSGSRNGCKNNNKGFSPTHCLPSPPGPSPPAPSPPASSFCSESGWTEVWADEFSKPLLDNSSWSIDLKGGDSLVRDSLGTVDNVYIENGALVLRSQKQQKGGYQYTSGAVQTKRKRSWQGLTRACVRAELPGGGGGNKGDGIWPAHWMMPDTTACWPSNGEIDIMEMVNGDGLTHGTYHWREREIGGCADKCANGSTAPSCHHPSKGATHRVRPFASEFHEYAVEYSKDHISFALDGVVFQHLTTSSESTHLNEKAEFFDVPYYMILNTAVGGPWPKPPSAKTTFPAYHRIDYVRIAQPTKEVIVV